MSGFGKACLALIFFSFLSSRLLYSDGPSASGGNAPAGGAKPAAQNGTYTGPITNPSTSTYPHPNGDSTQMTVGGVPGGTIVRTVRTDKEGNVVKSEDTFKSDAGPGQQGGMAGFNGQTYGPTTYSADGSGVTDILGPDGSLAGSKFFGPGPMASDNRPDLKGTVWDQVPEKGSWTPMADGSQVIRDRYGNIVKTIPPPGQGAAGAGTTGTGTAGGMTGTAQTAPPPPPVTTPVGSGTMTSTQNSDGTWSHHFHRDASSGGSAVDYDLKPDDPLYPHNDPRFWPQGKVPKQPVTQEVNGGTLTSTPMPDGTWQHRFRRENEDGNVLDYIVRPSDDLYPKDDPRFQPEGAQNQPKPKEYTGPNEIITPLPGGGEIESTRRRDGTWKHVRRWETSMGTMSETLKPGDDLYPKDDPRFQPISSNFGDDLRPGRGRGFSGGELAGFSDQAQFAHGGNDRHHDEG